MRAKVVHRGTVKTPLYAPTYQHIKEFGEATLYLGFLTNEKNIKGIMRGISQEKNNDPDKQVFMKMFTTVSIDPVTGETILHIKHKPIKRKSYI